MNDEIKAILADLNLNVYETKEWKEPLGLSQRTWKTLLDYITNLQEQLHQASLDIQELTERDIECPSWCDKLTNLQQENERLKWDKEQLNSLVNSCQDEIRRLKDQNINEILKKDLEICAKQYKKSDEKLEKYKSRIEKATNKVQDIIDIGFDYDGYDDADNLKILVDELVDLARQTKSILNGRSDE